MKPDYPRFTRTESADFSSATTLPCSSSALPGDFRGVGCAEAEAGGFEGEAIQADSTAATKELEGKEKFK